MWRSFLSGRSLAALVQLLHLQPLFLNPQQQWRMHPGEWAFMEKSGGCWSAIILHISSNMSHLLHTRHTGLNLIIMSFKYWYRRSMRASPKIQRHGSRSTLHIAHCSKCLLSPIGIVRHLRQLIQNVWYAMQWAAAYRHVLCAYSRCMVNVASRLSITCGRV